MSKIQPYDLHDAAEHGNLEFFGNLLSNGLPTNLFNGLGQLPIHTAVIQNQISLGKISLHDNETTYFIYKYLLKNPM